jgi:hypothetical protein
MKLHSSANLFILQARETVAEIRGLSRTCWRRDYMRHMNEATDVNNAFRLPLSVEMNSLPLHEQSPVANARDATQNELALGSKLPALARP